MASGGPGEVEQFGYTDMKKYKGFTIAISVQSALCTGISATDPCFYQYYHVNFKVPAFSGTSRSRQNELEGKLMPGRKQL